MNKIEYDERQMQVRYRLAFQTVIYFFAALLIGAFIIDMFPHIIHPADLMLSIMMLGMGYFILQCVLKDAYDGVGQTSATNTRIMYILAVIDSLLVVSHILDQSMFHVDGYLFREKGLLIIIQAIMIDIISITYAIKKHRDNKE